MGLVNGRGQIFMKLEINNYFPGTTPHAKFQGAMSTGGLSK